MGTINAICIDVLSILILAFIYANTTKRAEPGFTQHKLFILLIGALALLLVFDGISRAADGQPGTAAYYMNWASNLLLYLGGPLAPILWILYADYQVYHDPQRLRRYAAPLWVYFIVISLFLLSNIFTGWFFTVVAGNVFHREKLFWVYPLYCYILLLCAFVLIVANRKKLSKRHYYAMLLFIVPPTVGGILQSLFYGLATLISSMTLSALMLHFNTQDQRMDTDYLTGTYNRRLLDSYMREKVKAGVAGAAFSAILIDLNGFKRINDSLGHAAGDDALLDTVRLLRGCLRNDDVIARYGGDEFLVVLDIASKEILEEAVGRIRAAFERFNGSGAKPYQLSLSTGYDVYDPAGRMDAGAFLTHLDRLMYQEKRQYAAE